MMQTRWGAMALLLAVIWGPPLEAQVPRSTCFTPQPASQCRSWVITEAGAWLRISDRYEGEQDVFFHYALGWMRNVGARTALGGELFGGSDGHARGGVAVRARQWVSGQVGLDVVAGVHLLGDASGQKVEAGSPSVQLRLGYADKVALVGSVDRLSLRCDLGCEFVRDPNTTRTRGFLGLEVGSGLGALGIAGTAVGFAIVALLYDGS